MKKIIYKLLVRFCFGTPIQGEPIGEPTCHTIMPPNTNLSFNEWSSIVLLS